MTTGRRIASDPDLGEVGLWLGVRHAVAMRVVDATPLAASGRLVVVIPAAEVDEGAVRVDAAAALGAIGRGVDRVAVARPASVHPPISAHRQLAAGSRIDAALARAPSPRPNAHGPAGGEPGAADGAPA